MGKDSKMKQMEQIIIKFVNGRFLKIHGVFEGNHENIGNIQIEQLANNRKFSSTFNSKYGDTHGWSLKGVNLLNIELNRGVYMGASNRAIF